MRGHSLFALWALLACPQAAIAGQYSIDAVGFQGQASALTVLFAGDGETAETQTDLTFSGQYLTVSAPQSLNDAICLQVSATRLRVIPPSGGSLPLPGAATPYCSFQVAVAQNAPNAVIPLTAVDTECYTPMAQPRTCTLAPNSGVSVGGPPTPRTLSYTPAVGSLIEFPVGAVVGSAAPNRSIVVTANGNLGQASLTGCAISGSAAASFSVSPNSLQFAGSQSAALSVGCTNPAAEAVATLTCTEIDGDTPSPGQPRQFPLRCPAVVPPPNIAPTIHSSPVSGSTILVRGVEGGFGTSYVRMSNNGGSGTASTTITCYATGAAQISRHPTLPFSQGPLEQVVVGSSSAQDLWIRVPIAGTPAAPVGWVSCTVSNQPVITFAIRSTNELPPIGSPPPPPSIGPGGPSGVVAPAMVPMLDRGVLLALLVLLGGGAIFALQRRA